MTAARAVVAALSLVSLLAAGAAQAQVAPRRLVVYPVAAIRGASAADASDVASLVEPALHRVVQRTADVVLGEPVSVRAACGPAPAATLTCLAGISGGGLLLRVTVRRVQRLLVVGLEAVDAGARRYGPVTVGIDAYVQSSEPIVRGILLLVEQVGAAARAPDLRVAVPLPPPPPGAAPAPAVAQAAPPVAQRTAAAAATAGGWMRTAGPILTGTGAAVLAGALALSITNRSLSDELDRKFASGTLTGSDLASYRRVERNDRTTALLFAAGGALTLSGVAVWTAAPTRGGATAGVAGRF